jgi:YgiT-type zinc finger domain-containing protein
METTGTTCSNCGGADVRRAEVRSAFWHEDRLVVVQDIPALLCAGCGEQFYDDTTVVVLDLLRGNGFDGEARAELRVPVFSFHDRVRATGEP